MQLTDEQILAAFPSDMGAVRVPPEWREWARNIEAVVLRAQADARPVAWESTAWGYRKYITQKQYERLGEQFRKWYKPYRCSTCANPAPAAAQAGLSDTEILRIAREAAPPFPWGIGTTSEIFLQAVRAILSRAPATPQSEPVAEVAEHIDDGRYRGKELHVNREWLTAAPVGTKLFATQSAQPAEPSDLAPCIGQCGTAVLDDGVRICRECAEAVEPSGDERSSVLDDPTNLVERLRVHSEDRRNGAFARSAMREAAEKLAAQSGQRAGVAERVLDWLRANALPNYQIVVELNKEAASLYRRDVITIACASWDSLIEHVLAAAPTQQRAGGEE